MLDFPDEIETNTKHSTSYVFKEAAVVSNTDYCSSVGCEMLKKGGSAVDAAIATLLCEHLIGLQNTGIGGGVLMSIYQKSQKRAYCIDARETAPLKATRDMFQRNPDKASTGMLSVGVPGELMGYWEAHKKMGKLPWKDLFRPAIDLCLNGFKISHRLSKAFSSLESEIISSPTLRMILAPDGKLPRFGDYLKLPQLGRTLEVIASSPNGPFELYNGSLTEPFVLDIQRNGGIITIEDMASYKARWVSPVLCPLMEGDLLLHTFPSPGSGNILSLILKLLDDGYASNGSSGRGGGSGGGGGKRGGGPDGGWQEGTPTTNSSNNNKQSSPSNSFYLFIAEAFKHGYALRTYLGDPSFVDFKPMLKKVNNPNYIISLRKKLYSTKKTISDPKWYGGNYSFPEDFGTANICVVSKEGDSVAATSTINTLFGSLAGSPSTGIILNNEMDDFSSPRIVNSFGLNPCQSNFIEPGKRPFSSMCPSIFTSQEGDIKLTIGAAGGTHITTSVSQVAVRHLWFGQNIKEAIESPRIHHQLQPMVLKYETGLSKEVVKEMESYGHVVKKVGPHSSVTAISKNDFEICPMYDLRRGGSISGY